MATYRRLALAALSGAMIVASMAPWALWPLALVALVPLLLAVGWEERARAAVGLGLACGVVTHLGGMAWAVPAIARFQHVSVPAAVPFFVLLVLWQAVPFAVFAGGVRWLGRGRRVAYEHGGSLDAPRGSPVASGCPDGALTPTLSREGAGEGDGGRRSALALLAVAALWVVAEWAMPRVIPWYLGTALAAAPLLRQSADVAGVYGLSFLVVLVSVLGAAALAQRRAGYAVAAGALLAVAGAYGAARLHTTARATDDAAHSLTVAVVQGGLESGRDNLDAANATAWTTYATLTRMRVPPGTDLVVWPETVLRVALHADEPYRARLEALAAELDTPILLGALDHPRDRRGELNSAYLIDPRSAALDGSTPYHKRALLPFGEYVPGAGVIPGLARWRTTGEFVPGGPPRLLALRLRSSVPGTFDHVGFPVSAGAPASGALIPFAPSICLEAIQPGKFNEAVAAGAQFLVNLTDDGWFGDTALPAQHLQATVLRAVEARRWLVRASNSGISAIIDPTGEVVAALPYGRAGILTASMPLGHVPTPYVALGNWMGGTCLAGLLAVVGMRRVGGA